MKLVHAFRVHLLLLLLPLLIMFLGACSSGPFESSEDCKLGEAALVYAITYDQETDPGRKSFISYNAAEYYRLCNGQ